VSQQRIEDQAEALRELVQQKNKPAKEEGLSLPPRSEVHRRKKSKKREKKKKWKLKYPLIRLLVLFFILLPISMLSIYYANRDSKIVTVVTRSDTDSYEPIDIAPVEEKVETKSSETNGQKQHHSKLSVHKKEDVASAKGQKVITHVVQGNETLYSIAMKYYRSDRGMEIIKKWNHLQNAQLHQGQVLQIPAIDVKK
jgi:LysM repeat protein